MRFREADATDWPKIWPFWHRIVAEGETYMLPDVGPDEAARYWMLPPPAKVYVLEEDGRVLASALLKPNQPAGGDHVANASFMVDPDQAGRGLGRRLAECVLTAAGEAGYLAMQFNAVVETNTHAVRLWKSLGFEVLATVPDAFRHPRHGLVGAHIMRRAL
ncbi:GNAT family N-acetyltransferase [Actinoalloteichus spitiensis]|uniref:GNAT family N-acetyltransferase n=1 Tax=Actinoalloteichus spitiensis TaxID=252394 RepID=UPI00037DC7D8|nr:GNAT family N-acetyltransferase [Actinoalloteichus spitiensis]